MRCFPLVIPDPAGMGLVPAGFANAASFLMRSGLSPATMRISAAVSTPMPKRSSRCGARWATKSLIMPSSSVISSLSAIQRLAIERST